MTLTGAGGETVAVAVYTPEGKVVTASCTVGAVPKVRLVVTAAGSQCF